MSNPRPLVSPSATVYLHCPSRWVDEHVLQNAISTLESWGLNTIAGNTTRLQHGQLAGTDAQRAADLNAALTMPEVEAVLFLRGGYGAARMVDLVDWQLLKQHPKWLCGYSDATVLLCAAAQVGVPALHAEMAINFPMDGSNHSGTESLRNTLLQGPQPIFCPPNPLNRGTAIEGVAIGGNLSVLYSLLGSPTFPDLEGKVLFLEDLDEYLYHIDRMVLALKRAGKLNGLAGLVVGSFTQMKDHATPWGKTAEQIIADHVDEFNYPVLFNAPIGHTPANEAVVVGRLITRFACI